MTRTPPALPQKTPQKPVAPRRRDVPQRDLFQLDSPLIGEIRGDGLIYTVWESDGPVDPDPYLESYEWAAGLSGN